MKALYIMMILAVIFLIAAAVFYAITPDVIETKDVNYVIHEIDWSKEIVLDSVCNSRTYGDSNYYSVKHCFVKKIVMVEGDTFEILQDFYEYYHIDKLIYRRIDWITYTKL